MEIFMTKTKNVDIVDIKSLIQSGRFAVKLNSLGDILLEDTLTCEAVKLMQLPDTYSFHRKGTWQHNFIYTGTTLTDCTNGHDAWECSICGEPFDERHDWCTCGADMREDNKAYRRALEYEKYR
jgi:hypothetical protein